MLYLHPCINGMLDALVSVVTRSSVVSVSDFSGLLEVFLLLFSLAGGEIG